MDSKLTEFKLIPIDKNPVHDELHQELVNFLYNLPVGPRKYRDIQVGNQAIKIVMILNDVLKKHGLKIN
jgi:hypothetical protein